MRGFEEWSEEDVLRHNQRIKSQTIQLTFQQEKPVKGHPRSKYGNQKVEVNGTRYDSKKEAERGIYLEQKVKEGYIYDLERQKKFVLQPSFKFNGETIREIAYVADFVYKKDDYGRVITIVEDVKSPITRKNPVYRMKKKMMMYVHGIEVKEV